MKKSAEKESLLTESRLKELLTYVPESGLFIRNVSRGRSKAGDVAGFDDDGYVQIQIDGRDYLAHRLAVFYMEGEWPVDEVDHGNGCRSDNRYCNLKSVSQSDNMMNKGMYSNNASGSIGVSWNKRNGKWAAYVNRNGKRVHLGLFACYDDAVSARESAAAESGYHSNHGNKMRNAK